MALMQKSKNGEYTKKVINEIKGFSVQKIKEVLDFIYFIKTKDIIDPTQAYFWTKKWQKLEDQADKDKKAKKIIGNGSIKNLLIELKK